MDLKKLEQLDHLMEEQVASDLIVGGALRVIHDGNILYNKCFGLADRDNGKRITQDTIYRLYSMTKPIMAAAVMILYDRGKLTLQDPVCWFLPGFRDQKVIVEHGDTYELVPVNREVTIRDLLTMTSGLVYPDSLGSKAGELMAKLFDEFYEKCNTEQALSTVEMCNRIGQVPMYAQPGEQWNYGTSADVLGAVVEVVSGKKLSVFLKEELFDPLHMVDTGFYVPEEKRKRFAKAYIRNEEGKLEKLTWQHLGLYNKYKTPPTFEIGGAGLVSTINDYTAFAGMLLNQGEYNGKRILSPQSVEFLTTNHLTEAQKKTCNWESLEGYGYGGLMRVLEDPWAAGINAMGEYGWDGWTGNYFANDPHNKLTMIYMIQTAGGNGPRPIRALRQVIYSAL